MRIENLDREWIYIEGKPSEMPGSRQEGKTVNLPHDFMVEQDADRDTPAAAAAGFYPGGIGTYTKQIDFPDKENQVYMLESDGSYGITSVFLNGNLVGKHLFGYSPWLMDLTPYVKPGTSNRLQITVDNRMQPNARWYSGSGLYRHVDLLSGNEMHIAPWGVQAETEYVVGKAAVVLVTVTVSNDSRKEQEAWVRVNLMADEGREKQPDKSVTAGFGKIHLAAGEKGSARLRLTVPDARLWDVEEPNLYRVRASLVNSLDGQAEVLDKEECLFGIRTIQVDAVNGLLLNGKGLKMKGGCMHHDNGILGAASFYDSEYRRIKYHKDNGFNAIRFAHNPMSRDMLEACDRVGMLVLDEFFDTWTMPKNDLDFSVFFEKEWESAITETMLRDRNHPCILSWSIGNEIPERGRISQGWKWPAKLAARVRELDHTRPVMGALCSFFSGLDDEDRGKFWASMMEEVASGKKSMINLDNAFGREIWSDYTEDFGAPLDIVGYNYLNYHYPNAQERFPGRVILGSESKPLEMWEYWKDVEKYPYVIGDFVWTSQDYLGEAGIGKVVHVEPSEAEAAARSLYQNPYPWRASGGAHFDLCGDEKVSLAYRRILWGSKETFLTTQNPAFYNQIELDGNYGWADFEHHYTWHGCEGAHMKAEIYSSADEVELFQNGKSLGKRQAGETMRNRVVFELLYEPGILEAVSYRDGKEISRDSLESAGEPVSLRIMPEQTNLAANGQSLAFAFVEFADARGQFVPMREDMVMATVSGVGTLQAFGSANPKTEENYTRGAYHMYKGRVLAVVRAGYEAGEAVLQVSAGEMQAEQIFQIK